MGNRPHPAHQPRHSHPLQPRRGHDHQRDHRHHCVPREVGLAAREGGGEGEGDREGDDVAAGAAGHEGGALPGGDAAAVLPRDGG